MTKPVPSPLIESATSLHDELLRFEELCNNAEKAPLESEKSLERSAKLLREVAESDERLATHVRALVAAVSNVRDRQQLHADKVQIVARRLQERTEVFKELLQRYGALGQDAGKLNALVQEVAAERREGAEGNRELAKKLESLIAEMTRVADQAQTVTDAAAEKSFDDIGRQSDSLRQQLLAARNKMSLLHKSLSGS